MKIPLSILLIALCISVNAQKTNLNQSSWHVSDKIDASEFQPLKKTGLLYFISNDNDNIYFSLKIPDMKDQNRILFQGLTLWISMDDKPVPKMGVRYPMGSQNQTSQDSPLALANTIELIGFITEQERHFPADNSDNFRGSVKVAGDGILYYRLMMPVSKLPVRNSREGNGAMPFALGLEFGTAMSLHSSSNGPAPRSHGGTSEVFWINRVKLATSK
jgi:hypothetical protein